MEQATETGEVMSGWKELLIKQELERAGYIQALAKQDISRNQGARRLNVSLTYLSKLIDKYGIHWPARYGQGVGINKVPGGVAEYTKLANQGYSKADAARELDVSFNTVCAVAKNNKIKFIDGRTRGGLRSPKIGA